MSKKVIIEPTGKTVIIRRYKVRVTGSRGRTIQTSIPREVFERECRGLSITVEEGLRQLQAVWHYDSFCGLYLSFEPKRVK